jgi:hypothetical protein
LVGVVLQMLVGVSFLQRIGQRFEQPFRRRSHLIGPESATVVGETDDGASSSVRTALTALCRLGTGDILDRELQERAVFSMRRADCETIIDCVVGDAAALANESLTAPLNVEMIEQEPGSR